MPEVFSFLDGISPWWWVAAALAIAAIELVTFSYYLLWLALAAGAVAGIMWAVPGYTGNQQVGTFALLAIAATAAGWKLASRHRQEPGDPGLNNRAKALIGRSAVVTGDFRGGAGPVEVDGIRWRGQVPSGAPVPAPGTELLITEANGMTLILAEPSNLST
ncbi:MAG: NfeD family protein [Pseudomonadota bacterium]